MTSRPCSPPAAGLVSPSADPRGTRGRLELAAVTGRTAALYTGNDVICLFLQISSDDVKCGVNNNFPCQSFFNRPLPVLPGTGMTLKIFSQKAANLPFILPLAPRNKNQRFHYMVPQGER
jgi:hypothetical protein